MRAPPSLKYSSRARAGASTLDVILNNLRESSRTVEEEGRGASTSEQKPVPCKVTTGEGVERRYTEGKRISKMKLKNCHEDKGSSEGV